MLKLVDELLPCLHLQCGKERAACGP